MIRACANSSSEAAFSPRIGRDRNLAGALVRLNQGRDLAAQIRIPLAGSVEKVLDFLRRQLHGLVEEVFDLVPVLGLHDSSSLRVW